MRCPSSESRSRLTPGLLAAALVWLALSACGSLGSSEPALEPVGKAETPPPPVIDVEVYRRADLERSRWLEHELERAQADLRRAEEALIAAESGLRGNHSRPDAVSSLAAARIQVERAARAAPWRSEAIAEAESKLADAEAQIEDGRYGAALFFVDRARSVAAQLVAEAERVARAPGALFVRREQVNLRAGPALDHQVIAVLGQGTPVFPEEERLRWLLVRTTSGAVGWIYAPLVGPWSSAAPASPIE